MTPSFAFEPIWDAPHEAITAYRLGIKSAAPPDPLASRESTREDLRNLVAGIAHAARLVAAGLRAGGRYLSVIPISFDALSTQYGRMEIAATCRALQAELRPFMIFEVAGAPVGVPQSRMADLVCSIKPFCRAVTINLPAGAVEASSHRNAGHQGLGLQISSGSMPQDARDDVTRLANAAKRIGVASVVSGIASFELADHARRAGINYLSGPFIGTQVPAPLPVARLKWRDLVWARRHVPPGEKADATACGKPRKFAAHGSI